MRYFIIIVLIISCSSCSSIIAGKGKRYSHLERSTVSIDEIRSELGNPVYSKSYTHPLNIRLTSEYKKARRRIDALESQPNVVKGTKILSNGNKNSLAKYCDVYSCRGTFYLEHANMAYNMAAAMTLGLSEIVMIPAAIGERIGKFSKKDYLTIWYDNNQKYVATARGNLGEQSAAYNPL